MLWVVMGETGVDWLAKIALQIVIARKVADEVWEYIGSFPQKLRSYSKLWKL